MKKGLEYDAKKTGLYLESEEKTGLLFFVDADHNLCADLSYVFLFNNKPYDHTVESDGKRRAEASGFEL